MKEPNRPSRSLPPTTDFLISKLTLFVLGGILNYVSHIMHNAVNYLTTTRPLNLTFYCRHDIEVNCIPYYFSGSKNFKFTPVFLGKSTTYGKYRNHNHGLLRANAAGFHFLERFGKIQTQYSSDSTDGSFMYT